MTSDPTRDSWNRHKWRRDTSWWDEFEVDTDAVKVDHANVFDCLE